MTRHDPIVLGVRGTNLPLRRGRLEPLFYEPNSGFGLGGTPSMRLAARLASGPRADLWHFVFAPHAKASAAARALVRLRRARTVQTVASLPPPDADLRALLFGDRVAVLSRRTERLFLDRGVSRERLVRIAPCVAPVPRLPGMREAGRRLAGLPDRAMVVLFAGDLEAGRGAAPTLEAVAALPQTLDAFLVVASRRKTFRSVGAERVLRERAVQLGIADRVRWVGETPHIHSVIAAADVVALPTTDLGAKVDIPIVLLEALSLGVPVVVAVGSSAADLAEWGGAVAVEPHPDSLALTLERIVDDSESIETRVQAFEPYLPSVMARSYEALYDEILR